MYIFVYLSEVHGQAFRLRDERGGHRLQRRIPVFSRRAQVNFDQPQLKPPQKNSFVNIR